MNICAIVCEFNPFHNGHAYLIDKAKKLSGCDAILCIMGGNFSQRGEPTITDKLTRAKMAIAGGADAVVQIPTYLCSANAEIFAKTAIKIANSFDDVNYICFGSECGDSDSIIEMAKLLHKEPQFFKEKIKENLALGYSLGMSKTKAIEESIDNNLVKFTHPKIARSLLDTPNNILAVEYVKALLAEKHTHIKPLTIKRLENMRDIVTSDIANEYRLSSASTIRNALINSKRIWNIRKYIPNEPYRILAEQLSTVSIPDMDTFGKLALYKYTTTNTTELKANYDVVEGIENRLTQCAKESTDYPSFLELVTSRRFGISRIQRITIATLLNLRSDYVKHIYDIDYLPYIKLLAVKNNNKLLSSLSKCKSILVMRKLDAIKAQKDAYGKILMFAEDRANSVYNMLLALTKDQKHDIAQVSDIFVKPEFLEDIVKIEKIKAKKKEKELNNNLESLQIAPQVTENDAMKLIQDNDTQTDNSNDVLANQDIKIVKDKDKKTSITNHKKTK